LPITETAVAPTVKAAPLRAAPAVTWKAFVFVGWLAVVTAMALLLIQRMLFVRGLIAQSKDAGGPMVDVFEHCRQQISARGHITFKLSPVAGSPSVCGLFRSVILIPQGLAGKLDLQHLRSILLHELAHIKRGDLWVSFIQTILQIVYIYNPLLWLANAVIRKIREQAVDEMVLAAMGEDAEDYQPARLEPASGRRGRIEEGPDQPNQTYPEPAIPQNRKTRHPRVDCDSGYRRCPAANGKGQNRKWG
jgi:beta-lactamase regulating signal transducer with metallopeptidase domain